MAGDCDFCARLAAGEFHHAIRSDCRGCAARSAARSPFFAESRAAREWSEDYRTLIDRLGVTHDEVLAAARVDRLARNKGE